MFAKASIALAVIWAGGCTVAAIEWWLRGGPLPACAAMLGAGQFVLMWLALDPVCPRSWWGLTLPMKMLAAATFWAGGATYVVQLTR